MKSERHELIKKIEELRSSYSAATTAARNNMNNEILVTENKLGQLGKEIPPLEMQARNMEIQSLR